MPDTTTTDAPVSSVYGTAGADGAREATPLTGTDGRSVTGFLVPASFSYEGPCVTGTAVRGFADGQVMLTRSAVVTLAERMGQRLESADTSTRSLAALRSLAENLAEATDLIGETVLAPVGPEDYDTGNATVPLKVTGVDVLPFEHTTHGHVFAVVVVGTWSDYRVTGEDEDGTPVVTIHEATGRTNVLNVRRTR